VTGAATANFYYDADGKQVKSIVGGVTTYYVGQHYEKKGTTVTKYYFAGATRLAVRTNGTLSYLLGDHLGSSSVTTNASGVKTASALYKAFGETRYSSGALGTDYKFTGQREQAELGLYFYGARWYDSSLGRFTSPDTIVPTQTQGTQAWDRYAYANNNPVRYTDPTGHNTECGLGESCYGSGPNPNDPPSGGGSGGQACTGQYQSVLCLNNSTTTQPQQPAPSVQESTQNPTTSPPQTAVLHPSDDKVVSQEPIYDYSYYPPKLIGYRVTSYAIDDFHFSLVNYVMPSDAITWTSAITTYVLKPLLKPGVQTLATLGVDVSCPVCGLTLTVAASLDSVNNAITFDVHLRTYDVYFGESYLETPIDDPFR
jgi:RHS repeat-associated protein